MQIHTTKLFAFICNNIMKVLKLIFDAEVPLYLTQVQF